MALCLPAVIASGRVLNLASGSDQVNVLGDAALTFLAWLSIPLVFVAARTRRWGSAAAVAGIVVASSLALALTLWIARPQAPDGAGYSYGYEEAVTLVSGDVTRWLDEAVPGGWSRGDQYSETSLCVDRFGRDRGAVYGGPWYEMNGTLTRAEFEEFERAVSGPGREIQAQEFDRPEALLGQHHEQIVIRLNTFEDQGRSTIEIVSPCLRES